MKRGFCQSLCIIECKTETVSTVIALTSHISGHYAASPR